MLDVLQGLAHLAVMLTGISAVLALSAWRRSLVGTDRYQSTRAALVALLEYRRALLDLRALASSLGDLPHLQPEAISEAAGASGFLRALRVEQISRREQIRSARRRLDDELLHLDAVTGKKFSKALAAIDVEERSLRTDVGRFVMWVDPETQADEQRHAEVWRDLEPRYRLLTTKVRGVVDWDVRLESVVKPLEEELRSRLAVHLD